MSAPLLAVRGLVKRFGGVTALGGVDLELRPGEIHALCGENGAGKSTLIKVLAGIHPHGSYEGELTLAGTPARFRRPGDAIAAGIGVIHQELALVGELSVAENIALGREPGRGPFVDRLAMEARARELLACFRIDLDPAARVGSLSVGQQQVVEIARALGRDSQVLILDEPTAALSTSEVGLLLAILRDLRARGLALLYVSHRLDEVFAIADRITVLRDGASVASSPAAATDRATVIRHLVGRPVDQLYPRHPVAPGAPLLEVEGLDADPRGDGVRLRGISFTVHAGEVLGIGGLMGAGRSELLLHLFGAWGVRRAGRVRLRGETYDEPSPATSIARGLALVTEDRKRSGLVLGQAVGFNLSLAALAGFTRGGLVDGGQEQRANAQWRDRLRIKAAGLDAPVASLSGGNQQKVAIGKALMTSPAVILLDEPTRGIDIGAKLDLYRLIDELTAAGAALVLVSSELPELMGMADRILMLGNGRAGGTFARGEADADRLLAAALSAAGTAATTPPGTP